MLAITYRFHVLPRHRDTFRHAWQAARDALTHTVGLRNHDYVEPRDRHDAFTLLLAGMTKPASSGSPAPGSASGC